MIDLNRIYQGDCIEVMKTWPANFVDTIITDGPYGISFMGRDWDHGVPGVAYWKEMLRVAKPGATLLSFGGTRTYHRMTCAVEDAGWEIRDCLMFLHGQGFPKSHNFGCKCKEDKHENSGRMFNVQKDISQTGVLGQTDEESLLQLPVQREGKIKEPDSLFGQYEGATSGTAIRREQSLLAGRDLHRTAERLPNDESPESSGGKSKRIRDRTSASDGKDPGAISDADGGGSPHRPQQGEQRPVEPQTLRESLRPLDDGTFRDGTCPTCGGIEAFKGFGTALKPAFEPIIMAMKPLDGTFAHNAETWGVAGINVDGGRVKSNDNPTALRRSYGYTPNTEKAADSEARGAIRDRSDPFKKALPNPSDSLGRWPANLILDESAAAQLDGASGVSISSGGTGLLSKEKDERHGWQPSNTGGIGDRGGASRFFYVAKSGRAERNEGCEGMADTAVHRYGAGIGEGHAPDAPVVEKNHHPTVKPLSLMKYLCQLTKTPTGGIVLDPFAGSGTTLWAAEFHNRPWIGIEMNPEYVAIAEARIARERSQMKFDHV